MSFVTFYQPDKPDKAESYLGVRYIVNSDGYETIPQIMSRLMRGEIVDPKSGAYYDGDADEIEDTPDIPEMSDITDVDTVVATLHDMADKQREFKRQQEESEAEPSGE